MLTHLIRSKGPANIVRRGYAIASRVGLTPASMARSLAAFAELLARHGAPATFPVTAAAAARAPGVLHDLLAGPARIELAIHGRRHVDHSLLPAADLSCELTRARDTLAAAGFPCSGFRAPYLRWDDALLAALRRTGFRYDSSVSVLWPVVDRAALRSDQLARMNILLDFCRPVSSEAYPVLPAWVDGLLELPVSFPDDEMMVERLGLSDAAAQAALWTAVLVRSHARGELFVLQLHPERFALCADALAEVLAQARSLQPGVWLASLGEITDWWQEKASFNLGLASLGDGRWQVTATGSGRGALLVRGALPEASWHPWDDRYCLVTERDFVLKADVRPCIGVPAGSGPELPRFLADQGYVVESGEAPDAYAVYLGGITFSPEGALPLLARIEADPAPLVRFGRWPGGARSALAVTGDIDALTLRDYGLRLIGR